MYFFICFRFKIFTCCIKFLKRFSIIQLRRKERFSSHFKALTKLDRIKQKFVHVLLKHTESSIHTSITNLIYPFIASHNQKNTSSFSLPSIFAIIILYQNTQSNQQSDIKMCDVFCHSTFK